jgi:AcrR family transcriptional regulator
MVRPAAITLTRDTIVDAALELMDRDGYAAFTLPRLSEVLGVRTPSLYHHFRDRGELLNEVARRVVQQTPLPRRRPGAPWTEFFVDLSVNFRRTVLRHPNAAPVLVQFLPRDVMTPLFEVAASELATVDELPLRLHVLVLDGLEKLALGAALVESAHPAASGRDAFGDLDPQEQPRLARAAAASAMNAEQLFVAAVRAFLDGVRRAVS